MISKDIIIKIYNILSYNDVKNLKQTDKYFFNIINNYEKNLIKNVKKDYPNLIINENTNSFLFRVDNYGISMEKSQPLKKLIDHFIFCYENNKKKYW
jgi:hypothetical protein